MKSLSLALLVVGAVLWSGGVYIGWKNVAARLRGVEEVAALLKNPPAHPTTEQQKKIDDNTTTWNDIHTLGPYVEWEILQQAKQGLRGPAIGVLLGTALAFAGSITSLFA